VVSLLAAWARIPLQAPETDWRVFRDSAKLAAPMVLIGALYALKTVSRNSIWRDNMSLFSNGVTTSPDSCQAHRHYGSELINASVAEQDPRNKMELFKEGTAQLRTALDIYPHFADAWFKLGVAYQLVRTDYISAIFCYNRAIQEAPRAPGMAGTYNNLGIIYEKLGKEKLASYYFNRALAMNPYLPDGMTNHRRHMQKTGLDVRLFPTDSSLDPAGGKTAEQDQQAMSKILWGF